MSISYLKSSTKQHHRRSFRLIINCNMRLKLKSSIWGQISKDLTSRMRGRDLYKQLFSTKWKRSTTFLSSHDDALIFPLLWRHNGLDGVSNHQPLECLLNRSFRRRSKKTSKSRVTGLCAGEYWRPVNSPHKWPVTRKMFPFDDVIMHWLFIAET